MAQVMTLRLPDATAEDVKRIARREQRSLNEVATRIIEEWVRQNRFAHIEFRAFNGQREACIKGRLPVWQVIDVAKQYKQDVEKTAEHLSLSPEQVRAALNYYAAYPDEIDAAIEENHVNFDRLREMLPNAQRLEVHITQTAGELSV